MAKTSSKSSKKPASKKVAGDGDEKTPVQHSLLRKAEPDDKLLEIYQKIERKMTGRVEKAVNALTGCRFKFEAEAKGKVDPSDWLGQQEPGVIILQFHIGSAEQPVFVRVSRLFVTALVDCFYGGQYDGTTEPKPKLSRSESAMVERLARLLAEMLAHSWSTLCETPVRYLGYQTELDDIEIAADYGEAIQTCFACELATHEIDAIEIAQPVEGLIAIHSQLARKPGQEDDEIDPAWKNALQESVEQVFLPIRSVLARPTMSLSELSRLSVGDILPVAPTDNVPLIVGDRIFAHGSIGEQNGGVAFKINNFL